MLPTRRSPPSGFITEPRTSHTHSLILLHGLGSNGEKFGRELLDTAISSRNQRLPDILPGARFIFPTAKWRRSTAFSRAMLTQWFDIASLDDPSHRRHTQIQGLVESSDEVIRLVKEECRKVSPGNVILGGLSQGSAMAVSCLLALDFPVGGFIGMSGWLPFEDDIRQAAEGWGDNEDKLFAESGDEGEQPQTPATRVQAFLKDLLDIKESREIEKGDSPVSTPVFLGHGEDDDKVKIALGVRASTTLRLAGFPVVWKSYKHQGHWYKIPDEVDDIIAFISEVGWTVDAA